MAKTAGDQLIERLVEWGVHRVYGYPGDGIRCIATSGPGAIHLLDGLYDAKATTSRCWRWSASRRAARSAASYRRRSIS